MKVFTAQLNPWIGDFAGNVQKILASMVQARKEGAEVVLFAEMALCGYPPEDLLLQHFFVQEMQRYLEKIVAASGGLFVVVGLVRQNLAAHEKPLCNSAAVIADGALLGYVDKWLLPTYDVFDERRYFAPGKEARVWPWKGKKIAITICEDIWQLAEYERNPLQELRRLTPDLLLNLSASPYHYQKPDLRAKICSRAAVLVGCPLVLCCQVGGNDELVFDGHSAYFDEKGQLLHLAKGFVEDAFLVDTSLRASPLQFQSEPMRELYQALVLGVRDYFHKSGFLKACLGISGGVDSSLAACIAAAALGKDNVLGLCMPSRYSLEASSSDAELLAKNLGIQTLTIPIEGPFQAYLDLLEPHFGDRGWNSAEENLQARIRGMILMALSNKLGYVVLSTGNKSEMAMGYTTLYGDMCGGLGVISDVAKMQVYALAKWINREQEIIPARTLARAPSAELRPEQKDTDSLPPYPIVDAVLSGYVEEGLSAEEIMVKFQLPLTIVQDLIRRIHMAEYKRRQAPPCIRVTKKALRLGRRFPIVQGWR